MNWFLSTLVALAGIAFVFRAMLGKGATWPDMVARFIILAHGIGLFFASYWMAVR